MKTNQTTGLVPQVFNYDSHEVEVVMIDDAPYWVAKDVCDVLGIQNHIQALSGNPKSGALGLDDDEKLRYRIYTPQGGTQETWLVNESGLYNLIFRSNKPEAKRFRKWVTSEVLPAIRKTGGYALWNCELALYTTQVGGVSVRATLHEGKKYYHLGDLLASLGSSSKGYRTAKTQWLSPYAIKLKPQTFARPTYFTDTVGMAYVKLRKSVSVQLPLWEGGHHE